MSSLRKREIVPDGGIEMMAVHLLSFDTRSSVPFFAFFARMSNHGRDGHDIMASSGCVRSAASLIRQAGRSRWWTPGADGIAGRSDLVIAPDGPPPPLILTRQLRLIPWLRHWPKSMGDPAADGDGQAAMTHHRAGAHANDAAQHHHLALQVFQFEIALRETSSTSKLTGPRSSGCLCRRLRQGRVSADGVIAAPPRRRHR